MAVGSSQQQYVVFRRGRGWRGIAGMRVHVAQEEAWETPREREIVSDAPKGEREGSRRA
jgi:hypothetical protein